MLWQLESPASGILYLTVGDYWLGRDSDCDLFVDAEGVSRQHASLHCSRDGLVVQDQGSTNGVFVNGERIEGSAQLASGDSICFGQDAAFSVVGLEPTSDGPTLIVTQPNLGQWCLEPGRYTVGRSPDADITLDHPDVSRIHCIIDFDGERFEVRDNDSSNGLHDSEQAITSKTSRRAACVWLGPCGLFLARYRSSLESPSPVAQSGSLAGPPAAHRLKPEPGMSTDAWLAIVIAVIILIGGGLFLAHENGVFSSRKIERVQDVEKPPSAAEQRARQTAAVVAGNTEMRSRLRKLSRQSAEIRDFYRPVNNYLSRIAGDLDRLTSSPFTSRLLAGTSLATLSNKLNLLAGDTRSLIRDVNSFPENLGALDNALARYQRDSSRANLAALSQPARRTITQSERIEKTLGSVISALDYTSTQLRTLAARAQGWPMSGGLVSSARDTARLLGNGRAMLDDYRGDLNGWLRDVRRLEQEAAQMSAR